MIYSNPEFCLLFLLTLGVYLAAPDRRSRSTILIAASLLFYLWAGMRDTAIFLLVVAVSWISAALATRWPRYKRGLLWTGIAAMLLHLFVWKYASWATLQVQRVWPAFLGGHRLDFPLPIGISFFTLQGIAYLVDFSRDEAKYMTFPTYLLFKSFFAQLVAGPIVRARQLLPQLERLERPALEDVSFGLALFTLGFFKKLAIADRVGPFVDQIFLSPELYGRAVLIEAVLGYSVQIWADFSGYTDMGRGAARMLGIRLPENFLSPYLARSPSEFWRRWHITLSEWIRDYLYIPLGGSHGSPLRVLGVVTLVMALSGLWHGASWHFLVWGLYHGLLLALDRNWNAERAGSGWLASGSRRVATFALVSFGWLLFRAPSMTAITGYLAAVARGAGTASADSSRGLPIYLGLTFLIQLLGYYDFELRRWPVLERLAQARLWDIVSRRPALAFGLGALVAAVFAATIVIQPPVSAGFIYFQF